MAALDTAQIVDALMAMRGDLASYIGDGESKHGHENAGFSTVSSCGLWSFTRKILILCVGRASHWACSAVLSARKFSMQGSFM